MHAKHVNDAWWAQLVSMLDEQAMLISTGTLRREWSCITGLSVSGPALGVKRVGCRVACLGSRLPACLSWR
jgi:hypothetical protein